MKRLAAALGAAAMVMALSGPASAVVQTQTVADGSAVAFTLRPTYDAGGAAPLMLYVGYTAANVSTPEPEADGQGSWYNLAILEAGAFLPPEKCTPAKNAQATLDAAEDLQTWGADYIQTVIGAGQQGQQPPPPTVPGPRHPCTERFPGFAQSRYPATNTMAAGETDNYFDKPMAAQACREDPSSTWCGYYKQYWPTFRGVTGMAARDGSFSAESTDQPSQRSEAVLLGAGDGTVVSIGLGRTKSTARLEGETLIVESESAMDDICLGVTNGECTVTIDHMRQRARLVKKPGKPAESSSGTVLAGVRGAGQAQDVDASKLGPGAAGVDLGGYLRLVPVSRTNTCTPGHADPSIAVADAGGLMLYGSSGAGKQGGNVLIGGACARARIETTSFDVPDYLPDPGEPPIPPRTITVPGDVVIDPGVGVVVTPGAPRIVSRTVTRYALEEPVAWRTAPYWGTILGMIMVGIVACRIFPRHRAVVPAVRAIDRFTRQFLRG
ncbi:MAG: hypothetical protein WDA27_06080 [Actinomycetota bacterium]